MHWKIKWLWLFILVALLSLLPAARTSLASDGFDAQSFHPAVDDGPYFNLYGSHALEQWQWVAGTAVNYGWHPFQWITEDGERFRGVVDHQITQEIYGSVGLVGRWLEAGISLPVNWWVNFINPNVDPLTVSPDDQNVTRLGDVKLVFKTELVDLYKHKVGVAILPFVQFPTGSGYYYTGNGSVSGGGKLILDFLPLKRWNIGINFGALLREEYSIHNVDQGNQLLYGLGTAVDVTKNLLASAEVNGRTQLKHFWAEKDSSPLEMDAGIKYAFGDSGVKMMGGAGMGIVRGAGDARVRGFLGVAYHSPVKAAPPPQPPQFIRLKEQIHFKTAKWNILPASFPVLDELVQTLEAHPEIQEIQIEGHTDSRGSDAYNQRLSEKRARSVYDYLLKHGISADRMTSIGYGEARPIESNDTNEGRSKNRRTVIRITKVDNSQLPPSGDGALRYETGDPDLEKEGQLYPDR